MHSIECWFSLDVDSIFCPNCEFRIPKEYKFIEWEGFQLPIIEMEYISEMQSLIHGSIEFFEELINPYSTGVLIKADHISIISIVNDISNIPQTLNIYW